MVSLLLLFILFLSGCSADRRDQDMGQFFQKHNKDLVDLQLQLQQLSTTTGVLGVNLESGRFSLDKNATIAKEEAQQRFSAQGGALERVWQVAAGLALRKAYLRIDGSFWVILDESDFLGADYGFLRLGSKPITDYRTLLSARAMSNVAGWYMIEF